MIEKQLPYKYKVYELIKQDIIAGKYKSGYELNERSLSELLGVSRTPIREAIQMLEHDGWVVMETYKGAIVRSFDQKYLSDLMRVRMALELLAIEDAIPHITDAALQQIEGVYQLQVEASRLSDTPTFPFIQLDRSFHQEIYKLSDNETLIDLLNNYNDMICVTGIRALGSGPRRQETIAEHTAILAALRKRDVAAAVAAMKEHMEQTAQNIRQHADVL